MTKCFGNRPRNCIRKVKKCINSMQIALKLLIHACVCAGQNMIVKIAQHAFMQTYCVMSAMLVQLLENKVLEHVVVKHVNMI